MNINTTDEEIIVTYDLVGKPNTIYLVNLKFQGVNGQNIIPETMKGDVGEVETGKDKVIIWKVYEDVNGLEGSINAEFDIKEKVAPKPKVADKPDVQDTPSPKNPDDKVKVDDVIDVVINRGDKNTDRFGIKAGFGNSNANSNQRIGSFNRDFSWELGLFYRNNISRKIYIQPELIYHKQKYTEELSETMIRNYSQDQIRGQLIGGIKPFGLGLYFNAGLYAGANLGGFTETVENDNSTLVRFTDIANADDRPFNQFDFGYILGGSLSFNRGAFSLGFLVSRSFDNTLNNDAFAGDPSYENLSLRNRSVHFVLQKRLRFGKRK